MAGYHQGELELQALTGETETARRNGKMVQSSLPPGARSFVEKQRMLAIGRSDAHGRNWAELWFGEPGFARAERENALTIQHSEAGIVPGSALGILAIDLGSRRRFRINGVVSRANERSLLIEVREAYVNCPQYIQRRQLTLGDEHPQLPAVRATRLNDFQRTSIAIADTLFVASQHPTFGADVSHRGGDPGFVTILDDQTLRVPDYRGNGMFNTLGNLRVNPRAGVVIPDFERGRMLQLTGTTQLSLDREAGRYWDFHVDELVESSMPARFRWESLDVPRYDP
jgi:predicted pyridoxine 5'-phosphate oxidase superfamily flavin-nucleotide-binding protein